MASGLDTYEIEEDLVRLNFKDGSSRLVSADDLARHLEGQDLAKVRRAITLRRNFIETILPPWAKVLAVSVGAFALVFNVSRVAGIFGLKTPEPAPVEQEVSAGTQGGQDALAVNDQESAPQPTPHPQPNEAATNHSNIHSLSNWYPVLPQTASPVAQSAVSGSLPSEGRVPAAAAENASPTAQEKAPPF